jgi:AGZA family xanthine/uracil permease-like MFS transporter
MKRVREIDFSDIEHGLPAFFIMVLIALCYSISEGLAFGFIAYTLIQILMGKISEIKLTMWIITALSILYFVFKVLRETGITQ